ncbi:hypothetical protein NKH18_03415 [Streptomyces sp. M10(2022)]
MSHGTVRRAAMLPAGAGPRTRTDILYRTPQPQHRAERSLLTMPQPNRRVLVRSIDDISIEEVPVPRPGDNELLIRSSVVGICGSDTHAALGHHPSSTCLTGLGTRWSARSQPSAQEPRTSHRAQG